MDESAIPPAKPNTGSLFGRFKPKATLTTIVAELAGTNATSESPPPQFQSAGGKRKPTPPPEEELDLGDQAGDIFASILAGKSVKIKKTTPRPTETSTKVRW